MFSLICARIYDWVNNPEAGDLSHRAHYDITIMKWKMRAGKKMWWCFKNLHEGQKPQFHYIGSQFPSKLRRTLYPYVWKSVQLFGCPGTHDPVSLNSKPSSITTPKNLTSVFLNIDMLLSRRIWQQYNQLKCMWIWLHIIVVGPLWPSSILAVIFNTLRPRQSERHFADDISNTFCCMKIIIYLFKFQENV